MGVSKSDEFTLRDNKIAACAKALSHPARIAILQMLMKRNACVCGDIVDELPLSQSTVSQHLKELKSAGLIKGSIEGTSICYCIDSEGMEKASKDLRAFFDTMSTFSMKCC